MKYCPFVVTTLLIVGISCGKRQPTIMSDDDLRKHAQELVLQYPIIDGHVDFPSTLHDNKIRPGRDNDVILHAAKAEFDYDRAVSGGLRAPFMSIYVPAAWQTSPDYGKAYADTLIDLVRGLATNIPEKFALAGSPADVEANLAAGKVSLPMGMENGAPLGMDLKNVKYFYDRGIRYITLTHIQDNQICDSSGDTTHTWNGLSPFGRRVIKEMNTVGMMVDISHVDDSTFYQVIKLTGKPCIASHSSCRHFAPGARRDMTDDMIRKLGENGGVMLVNFYSPFLDSTVDKAMKANQKKLKAILASRGLKATDSLAKNVAAQFNKENPWPKIDISVVADHIDHIVKIAGIDHVGFGSDFDGVDGALPTGLTDPSMYPNLIFILLKRGYSDEDIEKINRGNLIRVWDQN